MSLHVALVRNVNLGQRGHPSTEQVLHAFTKAGAVSATSVRSNGTIVLQAPDNEATAIAHRAVEVLAVEAGVEREAFSMPLDALRALVAEHGVEGDSERRELTLHDGPALQSDDPRLIEAERRAHCTVLDSGPGWVVTLNHRDRQSNGTPLVEFVLGVPATSRGLSTLVMVCDRFTDAVETS